MIVGNDISKYQGDVNYDIYKNNSNFVIIKTSEGTGFTDPKFTRNQSEARRVGLPLGYYHFARPDLGNSAEKEAEWFLKALGEVREEEILCLDYEPKKWNGDEVGWCKRFLDYIAEKLGGYKCLIYLNQSQTQGLNWKPIVDAGYNLWIAAYTYDPKKNIYKIGVWQYAVCQQWTNKQQVPGISGNADGNVFFDDSAFKKYGYVKPIVPLPEPEPNPEPDCESQISGFKARNTDLTNQLAEVTQKYENKKEEVSRLEQQVLDEREVNKKLQASRDKDVKTLEARIGGLQGQIENTSNRLGETLIEKSKLEARITNLEKGILTDYTASELFNFFLKRLLKR